MILRQNISSVNGTRACHKIWADGRADHIVDNFGLVHLKCVSLGQAVNSTFFYQSSEAFEECHLADKAGKMGK